ncbi:MAG TPA: NAD-dependent epimerase/dehydratase family protein [Saprospiraceae bacterium]|nr:NAD-dependent epimerase/dehydratase family protein [Saprospiraceae bacterium]
MKVAITGASGHIGGLTVRELLERKHTIKVLVRGNEPKSLEGLNVETIQGDLDNSNALKHLMESCDALIHAAALISIDGDMKGLVYRTNVVGTRQVMEAAKAAGVKRVIHISSVHAYAQHPLDAIFDERRAPAGDNTFAYDRSKRDGQALALSYASAEMEILVVNPTSVVGPYDFKPSKLGQAIINMSTGKLPFVFKGGFDFCDGRDVAHAIVNALTMGRSGEAYLLGGGWCSLSEFGQILSEVSTYKNKPIALPTTLGWLGLPFIYALAIMTRSEPLYTNEALVAVSEGHRHINCMKAKTELHYTSRPLRESLTDTWAWFRENGYLG